MKTPNFERGDTVTGISHDFWRGEITAIIPRDGHWIYYYYVFQHVKSPGNSASWKLNSECWDMEENLYLTQRADGLDRILRKI